MRFPVETGALHQFVTGENLQNPKTIACFTGVKSKPYPMSKPIFLQPASLVLQTAVVKSAKNFSSPGRAPVVLIPMPTKAMRA